MSLIAQVLYGCLWLHGRFSARSHHGNSTGPDGVSEAVTGGHDAKASTTGGGSGGHGKVLSEPLSRTVTSVRAFSRELSRLGLVITFAYMCEHHPPFAHSKKVGERVAIS